MKTQIICAAAIIGLLLLTIYVDNIRIERLEQKIESLLKATEKQN